MASVRSKLASWVPEEGGLREVLDWHLSASGRMNRARLAVRTGRALGLAPALAVDLGAVAEGVHEASLLVDDINDRSALRRGRASAWARFGRDRAMLAAIRLLNSANRLLAAAGGDRAILRRSADLVGSVVERALDGQATEIAGPPRSWPQYDWIVRRKTGGLMALPLLLPACAAGLDEPLIARLRALGEQVGIAYQVADDLDDGDLGFVARLHPSPRQRIDDLTGQVRAAAAVLAEPFGTIVTTLLDDLVRSPVPA